MKNRWVLMVLILVVVVAVILTVTRMRRAPKAGSEVTGRKISVMDVESRQMVEVTVGDWEQKFKTDPATGYKLDERGRKLARPITCASCGKMIPPAPRKIGAGPEAEEKMLREYKCPICGKPAYHEGLAPKPPVP